MTWFWIALLAPLLYATANHIDKYLISKYFKGGEVGALIIFSSVFSIFTLPLILLIDPSILNLSGRTSLILALNGSLTVLSIILYFYALREDEASVVVPFYQTIPVFGYILGYLILGEVLTTQQIIACGIIILGAFVLALQLEEGGIRFRNKVVLFMLLASFLFAVNGVIFKLFAVETGFWPAAFWTFAGKTIIGLLLFALVASYRQQFLHVIRTSSYRILGLNSLNESVTIIADSATFYASLLAPVALVLTVNGFQPLFVFAIGVGLTLFFPHINEESLTRRHLVQKIASLALIIGGSYLLNFSVS